MNEIQVHKEEYRVVNNEAYLTITEAGKLLGITPETLRAFCNKQQNKLTKFTVNGKSINHLGTKLFSEATGYYASKTEEALNLLKATAQAGMTVFLYGSAGVELPSVNPPVPAVSTDLALKKLEIELEMAKLAQATELAKEHTKQLEIEAKVKLGKKKTGIRRLSDCPSGFVTMKVIVRELEDANTPIAVSALTEFLDYYARSIDKRANCIHKEQFYNVLTNIIDFCSQEGAFWVDKTSGIKFKADWL